MVRQSGKIGLLVNPADAALLAKAGIGNCRLTSRALDAAQVKIVAVRVERLEQNLRLDRYTGHIANLALVAPLVGEFRFCADQAPRRIARAAPWKREEYRRYE